MFVIYNFPEREDRLYTTFQEGKTDSCLLNFPEREDRLVFVKGKTDSCLLNSRKGRQTHVCYIQLSRKGRQTIYNFPGREDRLMFVKLSRKGRQTWTSVQSIILCAQ